MRLNPFRKRNREYRSKPQPEQWFPATLHPNECVFDRQFRCVRTEHDHEDGPDE